MVADMPPAEVAITVASVRRLIRRQFPAFADLDVVPLAHGWDNELFRLGPDLVVRLPRRTEGVALVAHEQRWLPTLTTGLPLATSTPIHVGRPDDEFPWPWSICRHLPGDSVLAVIDAGGPFDLADAAVRLGGFLAAFHRPAPDDAPVNEWRGVPIATRVDRYQDHRAEAIDTLEPELVSRVDAVVADAVAAARWAGPATWIHGDVHPGNLISHQRRLSGVVDFGDLTSGDPASDLSVAWTLFDDETRPQFQAQFDHDEAMWRRARGWTAVLGMAVAANSGDNPPYARMGRRMLHRAAGWPDPSEG